MHRSQPAVLSPFPAAAVAPAAAGSRSATANAARRCQFQAFPSAPASEQSEKLGRNQRTQLRAPAEVLPALCHDADDRSSQRRSWRKNRHPETRTHRVPENSFFKRNIKFLKIFAKFKFWQNSSILFFILFFAATL